MEVVGGEGGWMWVWVGKAVGEAWAEVGELWREV